MIFLTIGTHEPFDRLVRAVDDWYGSTDRTLPLFGQITDPRPGGYRPRNFPWVSRLTPSEYADRIARSGLIVAHAGMGSIITALHHRKSIVIMPRRGHLQETRNDHQFVTARMLGSRPGIHVADDETALPATIARALASQADPQVAGISDLAEAGLTDALRAFILNRDDPET